MIIENNAEENKRRSLELNSKTWGSLSDSEKKEYIDLGHWIGNYEIYEAIKSIRPNIEEPKKHASRNFMKLSETIRSIR